ncbi:response regulator transcription factor [Zunongwangia atlantica]|uniref:Two-component system response regulator n=1 Tax=Zunongwangia atlantica 22II14-10F7 TaxID=1185767 RepID=A0A1Y1T7Q6_9FLAO|nr:response regulator transcription factor [Zunongwangia atlantica]ORL46595.1 two-component system response regulator [Zunongwangia atlantica 22II14-10F7]
MKILIVEDELQMLENIQQNLEKENYLVETAHNCKEAQEKIGVYNYDCILLDIGLPDGDGLSLLQYLKSQQLMEAVIIVSAKDSLDDKLKGLELGADDYLPKPFYMAELNARIKAVLRRRNFDGNNSISLGNTEIFPEERRVKIKSEEVELNRKEFDILMYLVANKERLVRKPSLAEHVWGDNIDQADSFEFIYSQIKNLRKKLKSHQSSLKIKAVYGVGYKLMVE